MSDKNVINGENTSATADENKQSKYLEARALEEKGKTQPSKLSDWPLIGYVAENNGDVLPIYRSMD